MPPRVSLPPKASLRYPALSDPPSYKGFLVTLSSLPENRRALPALDKSAVDGSFESLLRKRFVHDESAVVRHMQIARNQESQQWWDKIRSGSIQLYGNYIASPEVTDLRLPNLGQHIKNAIGPGRANEYLDRQTYKDFADKAIKDNPTVTFTKQVMDDAFHHGASRTAKSHKVGATSNPAEMQKMLKRCLGKESDQYWQKRAG
ncbi:hypothetical protein LTR27_007778 [Elasticomyces elasticus]|nr:hypothetical protein LTR27_007778 [Elasticomyces elasticus]